ncbi:MAG: hypothetical protein ACK5WS_04175 [Alphaproteobacteria bacterium]|jgi:hypothetical protein|nr:hypothetical protein [Candidatus Jidaibacter sp.]
MAKKNKDQITIIDKNIVEENAEKFADYVNSKIFEVKAQIIKWVVGSSMIQLVFNYALSLWGLS